MTGAQDYNETGKQRGMTRKRVVIAVLAALLLLGALIGAPYLAAYEAAQSATSSAAAQRTAAAAANTAAGVKSLLQFVASVQNGPAAKESRDSTVWVVAELEAICAGEAGCRSVPLPSSLRGSG